MIRRVLIFGGSGFLGKSLTKALIKEEYEVCIVSTNKEKALSKIGSFKNLDIKSIDIFNSEELKKLIQKNDIVINLIGKIIDTNKGDFEKFHYTFPKLILENISTEQHLIHISALGIESSSKTSIYARTKLDGENLVIEKSQNYNIIKPSIVFGEGDKFFNLFSNMSKLSLFLPLIGSGKCKFAPVYVEDVSKSIIYLINNNQKYKNQIFEAHGLDILSFDDLISFVIKTTNRKRLVVNLPFYIAKINAKLMNFFKVYLLTSDQVELLKYDNVGSNKYENIDKLIGCLKSYKDIVPRYLQ